MNMNIPGMQQQGPMGMNPMVQQNPMGGAQHGMHPQAQMQQPQQPQEKVDSISKVKGLIGPLRDSLSVALKTAGHTLLQNSLIDTSAFKGAEHPDQQFNKSIEEFYSICDQMELHLRTSIECIGQNMSSMRYMPVTVSTRSENIGVQDALTYPQYLMTVRAQVQYVKTIHDMLYNAAHSLTPPDQQ